MAGCFKGQFSKTRDPLVTTLKSSIVLYLRLVLTNTLRFLQLVKSVVAADGNCLIRLKAGHSPKKIYVKIHISTQVPQLAIISYSISESGISGTDFL